MEGGKGVRSGKMSRFVQFTIPRLFVRDKTENRFHTIPYIYQTIYGPVPGNCYMRQVYPCGGLLTSLQMGLPWAEKRSSYSVITLPSHRTGSA